MVKKAIVILLFSALLIAGCGSPYSGIQETAFDEGLVPSSLAAGSASSDVGDSYIVVFTSQPGNAERAMLRGHGAEIEHTFHLIPGVAVRIPNRRALTAIERNPNVEFVEKDELRYALGEEVPWGVIAVNAPGAWTTSTGDGVKVAVLDTGIDYTHPDLVGNYVAGGYDFINKDEDPMDDRGHGTHCAGTIGAVTNNDLGVASVAFDVDLYSVKVLGEDGSGRTTQILRGVEWAVDNGMDIASMSLGGGRFMRVEERAYNEAAEAGLLVICASGNESAVEVSYPAAYEPNMAVGAVDSTLTIADFSNTGEELDIVAPGVHVLSTVPVGWGTVTTVTAGDFSPEASSMEYASLTDGTTGNSVFCSLGEVAEDFPAEVAGNIALIQRGNISFQEKVVNAMAAGAIGVIIYNNEPGEFLGTLGEPGDYVPTVSMSMEDGETLLTMGEVSTTITVFASDYDYYDGTSMATPHVSAVAALVKAANPSLTNEDIKTILTETATDLGATGWDSIYGWGLVNAEAAVAAALGGE